MLYILKQLVLHNVAKETSCFIRTQEKKLQALHVMLFFLSHPKETVTNISSHSLTPDELEVLKFGLKHSIRPPKLSKADVFTTLWPRISRTTKCKENWLQTPYIWQHMRMSHLTKPSNTDIKKHI